MTLVTVSEAARLANISRQHLYKKYINNGLLSVIKDDSGAPAIDTSELLRVFGTLHGDSKGDSKSDSTRHNEDTVAALSAELAAARAALAERDAALRAAEEREQWMRQHVSEITSALRLIEHKPARDESAAAAEAQAIADAAAEEARKAREALAAERKAREALRRELEEVKGRGFWSRLFNTD